MTKKSVLISAGSLLVLVIGIGIGLSLIKKPQKLESEAATPTGTATFKLNPASGNWWVGQTQTIQGVLKTINPILAYQVVMYLTYTTANSPVDITATTVTSTEPALSCVSNSVSLDTAAKKYTVVVSCTTPATFPPTSYTTNSVDKTVFTLSIKAVGAGTLSYSYDNSLTKVNKNDPNASDDLLIPTSGSFTIQSDTTAPQAISSLTTSQVTNNSVLLSWSAPSDTGPNGQAASYEIRRSTSTITPANWTGATIIANPPTPAAPGTNQTQAVSGLTPGTTYYFALRSTDAANNQSVVSNVATTTTTNQGNLSVSMKFQGGSTAVAGKTARITVKQGTTTMYTFASAPLTASGDIYSANLGNVNGGTYDIYLKGPAHLQKKVAGIGITSTGTTNWPAIPPTLLAGDIDNSNSIDSTDSSLIKLKYNPLLVQTPIEDLNWDSRVDSTDYSLMLLNYNPLATGD